MNESYLKKKLYYLAVSITFLFFINANAFANPVSVDTAQLVAENWLTQITGVEQQSLAILPNGQAELLASETSPAYYVVTMEQGGWAIVSGDDVAQPIIGYAAQGTIDPDDLPPAFNQWMDIVKEQIEKAAQDDTLQSTDSEIAVNNQNAWENLATTNYEIKDNDIEAVSPLVTTTWSQGTYYNRQCPVDSAGPDGHALVGCCATAISQVMKYHNWPNVGTGSHSYTHSKYGTLSANFGSTSYNWSSMPSSGSLSSHNSAVARLMYHVGVSIDMNYGPSSSGCSKANIAKGLGTYFKYKPVSFVDRSSYTDSTWKAMMRTDLNASRPIVYVGVGSGGHAFVCDGYQGTEYFHFNWGWNGSYDGYFYITDLTPGSHNYNSYQGAIFDIEPLDDGKPDQAILISPSGNISDHTPTYRWNRADDASWYYLYVDDSSGHRINKWYRSIDVCSGSTCSTTPATSLADGNAKWWVLTWNSSGYGPWSAPMNFSVGQPAPGKAVQLSPSGATSDRTPTYRWEEDENATWYYLYVNDSSGHRINKWYSGSAVCDGGDCSITPSTVLAYGNAKWWVRTWNSVGLGPWSNGMNFYVQASNAASLIAPAGIIHDTTPQYRWHHVENATWYYLYVNDSSGHRINKWYSASDVCDGDECLTTPATILAGGNARWWIQNWNPTTGYGQWSAPLDFEVKSAFNSQFNGNASGWWKLAVTAPWHIGSHYYYTYGAVNSFSSVYYGSYLDDSTKYADFDYQVKLWRNGDDDVSSGIMFRGLPAPAHSGQRWDKGYGFYYTRNGSYSLWSYTNGVASSLKSWTSSSYINKYSAWNILRVRAIGSHIYFYINGHYLGMITNSLYTNGKAGMTMYRTSSAGTMWADYAVLQIIDSASSVSNDAATTEGDGFVIDEAALMEQGGESANGDDIGVGQVSLQNDSQNVTGEALPEVSFDVLNPELQP